MSGLHLSAFVFGGFLLSLSGVSTTHAQNTLPVIPLSLKQTTHHDMPYLLPDITQCQIMVNPSDTSDFIEKAASNPGCTLNVSGTYTLNSTVLLNHNTVIGQSNEEGTAPDTDIPVYAAFVASRYFNGDSLFYGQGPTSFESIRLVSPVNPIATPSGRFPEGGTTFVNTIILDPEGKVLFRAHTHSSGTKTQGSTQRSANNDGKIPRNRSTGQITRKPSGNTKGHGDRPPRKPTGTLPKRQPADKVGEEISVSFILSIVRYLLNTEQGEVISEQALNNIRKLYRNASPRVKYILITDAWFYQKNKEYDLTNY